MLLNEEQLTQINRRAYDIANGFKQPTAQTAGDALKLLGHIREEERRTNALIKEIAGLRTGNTNITDIINNIFGK
jgi:hypothetical protein